MISYSARFQMQKISLPVFPPSVPVIGPGDQLEFPAPLRAAARCHADGAQPRWHTTLI